MVREAWAALFVLTGGCASKQVPEPRALAGAGGEAEISRIMEDALLADSRGESADSLYAPYVTVVADGRLRRTSPRFAGVAERGELAVTSTQVQTRAGAAWGDVEYRWISDRSNRFQVGRASFVFIPAQGRPGWWIVQVHSSTVK